MLINKILLKILYKVFKVQSLKNWKYSLNHPQSRYCEWKNFKNKRAMYLINW